MRDGFVPENILGIYGIINGTTNFVLSAMADTGLSFKEGLEQAQDLGYAEADPTFDIEGVDSAHKIALLAMMAYGVRFDYRSIPTSGISAITKADINFAKRFGYKIKLTAIARMVRDRLDIRVHPSMLPEASQLAQVDGVFNAVYLEGDNIGPAMLFGQGAGSLPTASAVISDIIAVGRNRHSEQRVPNMGTMPEAVCDIELLPSDEITSEYYVRLAVVDQPGVLGQITTILGSCNISIASILQEEREEENAIPIVLMTHTTQEGDLRTALAEIEQMPITLGPTTFIRVIRNLS
jgi:homoserine dehydrogenase